MDKIKLANLILECGEVAKYDNPKMDKPQLIHREVEYLDNESLNGISTLIYKRGESITAKVQSTETYNKRVNFDFYISGNKEWQKEDIERAEKSLSAAINALTKLKTELGKL